MPFCIDLEQAYRFIAQQIVAPAQRDCLGHPFAFARGHDGQGAVIVGGDKAHLGGAVAVGQGGFVNCDLIIQLVEGHIEAQARMCPEPRFKGYDTGGPQHLGEIDRVISDVGTDIDAGARRVHQPGQRIQFLAFEEAAVEDILAYQIIAIFDVEPYRRARLVLFDDAAFGGDLGGIGDLAQIVSGSCQTFLDQIFHPHSSWVGRVECRVVQDPRLLQGRGS